MNSAEIKLDLFRKIDNIKEAQEFIDEVYETEFILKQGFIEFQDTDINDVKRCVICKQITLFYKIIDKKNHYCPETLNFYKKIASLRSQ